MISLFVFLKAICGKLKPCLNGGNCESSTGTCNCASHSFVGDFCHVPVGKDVATHPFNPLRVNVRKNQTTFEIRGKP